MRLSDFILRDMKAILAAWDSFAGAQTPAAERMDAVRLRNHAEEILRTIAKDLQNSQTSAEQHEKSLGRAPRIANVPDSAAESHGFLRAQSGFNIKQLVAEFRALRASVLHLWAQTYAPEKTHIEDMIRFNEAIDQAVSESVAFFSAKINKERNLLYGALGHDMRSPLHIIHMSAGGLAKLDAGEPVSIIATRIAKSAVELKSLLDDLVDFNRTNLGLGLPIAPIKVDLSQLFAEALEQLRAGHPEHEIKLDVTGDTQGTWDPHRLHQLLGNLVLNALKYGSRLTPVRVVLAGRASEVEFSIHNQGPKIDSVSLPHIFDPLVRGNGESRITEGGTSLGLGLYIARQITHAHGGDIAVRSDDLETVFTVRLPRLISRRDRG